MFARISSIISFCCWPLLPGKTFSTTGKRWPWLKTCCCRVATRAARSSETTGCTIDSGTFCPSTRISELEVYFAGNANDSKNPMNGARTTGTRITIARRRNIAE